MTEDPAFTAASVHALLVGKRVLRTGPSPSPKDPAVAELARRLNWEHLKVGLRRGPHQEQLQRRKQLVSALVAVNETLPLLRYETREAAKQIENHENAAWIEAHHSAVRVVEDLAAAVDAALNCNLLSHPVLRDTRPIEWDQYADRLAGLFLDIFPHASDQAAFRFVVEVAPIVTGDERPITFQAVRTLLNRKRDKPWGI